MSTHNLQFHDKIRKKFFKYLFSWAIRRNLQELKNKFELAVVNKPLTLELLRLDCINFTERKHTSFER